MESQTIALITAWFAVGALTALVLSVLQVSFVLQVAAFFVVSASLLALLRPLQQAAAGNAFFRCQIDFKTEAV